MQLAIDILRWPGFNVAFVFSFVLTIALSLVALPYSKRRPKGTPVSWGEAMIAATYVFGVLFLAFGVVPHQWIDHADKNLGWTKAKIIHGPGGILKPQADGGWLPLTLQYEFLRDTIVVVIHVIFFGLMMFLWSKWQKRGQTTSTDVATSTYGRPLVKKA